VEWIALLVLLPLGLGLVIGRWWLPVGLFAACFLLAAVFVVQARVGHDPDAGLTSWSLFIMGPVAALVAAVGVRLRR